MSRPRNLIPTYSLHRPSGQARVRINGQDLYLGPYDTDESRKKYGELISQLAVGLIPGKKSSRGTDDDGPSVAELLLAFKSHAEQYYVKNGKRTAEVDCFYSGIRAVRELFGVTPIREFSPSCLIAVRDKFIQNGWTRSFCNKSTNRVRHIFKWGVANGLVPVEIWQALTAVDALKAGKTTAPDRKKRKAVPVESQEAARAKLCPEDQRFFDLLRYSGARPSELLGLAITDIDQTGVVWTAAMTDHKCRHLDQDRTLYFGPRCQAVLRECPQNGPMFRFSRTRFSARLKRACVAAKIEPFVPYSLRHSAATSVRDSMGVEAAQGLLGHARPDMTANYSRMLENLARKAAERVG